MYETKHLSNQNFDLYWICLQTTNSIYDVSNSKVVLGYNEYRQYNDKLFEMNH